MTTLATVCTALAATTTSTPCACRTCTKKAKRAARRADPARKAARAARRQVRKAARKGAPVVLAPIPEDAWAVLEGAWGVMTEQLVVPEAEEFCCTSGCSRCGLLFEGTCTTTVVLTPASEVERCTFRRSARKCTWTGCDAPAALRAAYPRASQLAALPWAPATC
jgi:hypothetical protein